MAETTVIQYKINPSLLNEWLSKRFPGASCRIIEYRPDSVVLEAPETITVEEIRVLREDTLKLKHNGTTSPEGI